MKSKNNTSFVPTENNDFNKPNLSKWLCIVLAVTNLITIITVINLWKRNLFLENTYTQKAPLYLETALPIGDLPQINQDVALASASTLTSPINKPVINPSPSPTLTPSATPFVDNIPPVINSMSGPENNSTINYNNFCFPMYVTDNVSKYPNIFIRVRFDSEYWGNWSTNASPCYQAVTNGQHTFAVQLEDEAGNLSNPLIRTFTVKF